MRKVVAGLFLSLDGVAESPDQWQFDSFDEDLAKRMSTMFDQQDLILMGRVTYNDWKSYWPTSKDEPYATLLNQTPKVVVSTTLKSVEWGSYNTAKLLEGTLAEGVNKLKQQPGKNIGLGGSPTLVRSLLEEDLLDELVLMVHPVVAGTGKRLFKDGSKVKQLKLVDNHTTSTGVAILSYHPK